MKKLLLAALAVLCVSVASEASAQPASLDSVTIKPTLAGGQAYTMPLTKRIADFKAAQLLISWTTAAAADSDSVAIAVYVYVSNADTMSGAVVSTNQRNYLLAPRLAPSDSVILVRADTTAANRFRLPPTALIMSVKKYQQNVNAGSSNPNRFYLRFSGLSTEPAAITRTWYIPPSCIRWVGGSNAISIPLGDITGVWNGQRLGLTIANVGTTTLTNVTTLIWPKTN